MAEVSERGVGIFIAKAGRNLESEVWQYLSLSVCRSMWLLYHSIVVL